MGGGEELWAVGAVHAEVFGQERVLLGTVVTPAEGHLVQAGLLGDRAWGESSCDRRTGQHVPARVAAYHRHLSTSGQQRGEPGPGPAQ